MCVDPQALSVIFAFNLSFPGTTASMSQRCGKMAAIFRKLFKLLRNKLVITYRTM